MDMNWQAVPYFSQFPPVYYGYEDNMPVVKAPAATARILCQSVASAVADHQSVLRGNKPDKP